jgi:hypothetical protein
VKIAKFNPKQTVVEFEFNQFSHDDLQELILAQFLRQDLVMCDSFSDLDELNAKQSFRLPYRLEFEEQSFLSVSARM